MSSSAQSAEAPLFAEGGLRAPVRVEEDPYRALDELMAAVEALCPVWPSRDDLGAGSRMLLVPGGGDGGCAPSRPVGLVL